MIMCPLLYGVAGTFFSMAMFFECRLGNTHP